MNELFSCPEKKGLAWQMAPSLKLNESQEDFFKVSGRTYLSELERGLKTPTLDKIDALASTIGIHPISLLAECYKIKDEVSIDDLWRQVDKDLTRADDP